MESTLSSATNRQKNKFESLYEKKRSAPKPDSSRTVINLSQRELSQDEITVLARGGNFAITPTTIPVEDIIANVESGIRTLPSEIAEEIRLETSRILNHAKTPKSNISGNEKRAIKNLNADTSIVVLPADKGNATVILNTDDYNNKIKNLLDPATYKKLSHNPTSSILRKTSQLIKKSSIEPALQSKLYRTEAFPPRLYGLPKIHKHDVPLRPIVSAIGSPTYDIAKYLTTLLQPFIGQSDTYVKDSTHFLEKITDITLKPHDILVSFDVVSLFTMVPVGETLQHIGHHFPEDIKALFKHCLSNTYFQWNQDFYEQTDGVAMGSPLSPVVANFFMEKFEQHALETASKRPSHWFRYVDDTFVIWSHGEQDLDEFLRHLNSINNRIQFTMEKEKDKQIAFLDLLIEREDNGKLGHRVYRKPTHTDRYLNKDSNHHPKQKRGIIKTLTDRAIRLCQPKHLPNELKHLKTALQNNGYSRQEIERATRQNKTTKTDNKDKQSTGCQRVVLPFVKNVTDRIGKLLRRHDINTTYKPTRTINQSLRSVKDQRDPLSAAGVYRIPCSCGSVYVGTTKRSINTRLAEHKRSCRLGHTDKSAVAEHTLTQEDHKILFDQTQVLANVSSYYPRLYREAIEIHKHKRNFNKKDEGLNLSKTWTPALRQTKTLRNREMSLAPDWPRVQMATPTPEHIKPDSATSSSTVDSGQSRRNLRPLPHRL